MSRPPSAGGASDVTLRRMLRETARVLMVAIALMPAGTADSYGDRATERAALFERLAEAESEAEGRRIENEIWRFWTIGPDAEATDRMDRIMERRRAYDLAGALAEAEALVERNPGWAEAWNQKATLLFLTERPDAALDAVEEVLAREPRHFGALAGKAVILMRQGRMRLAQQALREAVAIHPWLRERDLLIPVPGTDL